MRRRFINIQDNDYGVIRINSNIIADSFINGTIFPQNIFKKAIIEFGDYNPNSPRLDEWSYLAFGQVSGGTQQFIPLYIHSALYGDDIMFMTGKTSQVIKSDPPIKQEINFEGSPQSITYWADGDIETISVSNDAYPCLVSGLNFYIYGFNGTVDQFPFPDLSLTLLI